MNFSAFIKENPGLMGQAMSSLGGGGGQQQQQGPQTRDAGPGVEPIRVPADTGDKGYEGAKNVAKTIASFYFGGAGAAKGLGGAGKSLGSSGAGSVAQNIVSTAAAGRSQQAPVQSTGSTPVQPIPGQAYDAELTPARQAERDQYLQSQQPWMKGFGRGFTGG